MIIQGDCLEEMKKMNDCSIDFIVTDPPYGLNFMGKDWDKGIPDEQYWKEMLRILKPGSHLAAMGGTRTFHKITTKIENAGFEIRDCIMWLYGSGFPKSHNKFGLEGYGTALKPAWEPIILAMKPLDGTYAQNVEKWGLGGINIDDSRIFPVTGQRLSDIILEKGESEWEQEKYLCNSCVNLVVNKTKQEIQEIMESFVIKNVEQITIENVKKHLIDTNILDIGCLDILFPEELNKNLNVDLFLNMLRSGKKLTEKSPMDMLFIISTMIHGITGLKICNLCKNLNISATIKKESSKNTILSNIEGLNRTENNAKDIKCARWPANLILDEEAAEMLDRQSGVLKSGSMILKNHVTKRNVFDKGFKSGNSCNIEKSCGGASRFFYCAKASSKERNTGLDSPSTHPTVKPLSLMRYILKLLAPPNNPIVLDPFAGSGSTLCAAKQLGIRHIGIELEKDYCDIAQKRLDHIQEFGEK